MADIGPLTITTVDCPVVRPASMPRHPVAGIGYAVENGKIALVLHHVDGETLIGILSQDTLHFLCTQIAEALDAADAAPAASTH